MRLPPLAPADVVQPASQTATGMRRGDLAEDANSSTGRFLIRGGQHFLLASVWAAFGRDHTAGGLRDLAAALREWLAKGLQSGKNIAPELTRTMNGALDAARQVLESQGSDPGHVRQLIESFRSLLAAALDDLAQASKDR